MPLKRFLQRTALLTLMIGAPLTAAHAGQTVAAPIVQETDRVVHQWVSTCNGHRFTTNRVNALNPREVAEALNVLLESDEIEALGKLPVNEACLTLAGTQETGRPTFVLKRSVEQTNGVSEAMIRTLPLQAQAMTLANRLDELNLDIHGSYAKASERFKKWQDADPELAKGIMNQGIAQMTMPVSRAVAFQNPGATSCLIVLEPKPLLEDFLSIAPEQLAKGISENDRQWLARYGDATEFWHEVSHCQKPENLEKQTVVKGPESGDGARSCTAIKDNKNLIANLTDGKSMFPSAMQNAIGDSQTKPPLGQATPPLEQSPAKVKPVSASEAKQAFQQITDYRQLVELSHEALMDRMGLREVAKRFGLPDSGCTTATLPSHPWAKFRVIWSIGEPDPRYMSWLQPWLVDQPMNVQRHLLADAWGGLLKTKKIINGKFVYRDWMLNRISEKQRASEFQTPTLPADPERAEKWAAWLTDILKTPSGIQGAIQG